MARWEGWIPPTTMKNPAGGQTAGDVSESAGLVTSTNLRTLNLYSADCWEWRAARRGSAVWRRRRRRQSGDCRVLWRRQLSSGRQRVLGVVAFGTVAVAVGYIVVDEVDVVDVVEVVLEVDVGSKEKDYAQAS